MVTRISLFLNHDISALMQVALFTVVLSMGEYNLYFVFVVRFAIAMALHIQLANTYGMPRCMRLVPILRC